MVISVSSSNCLSAMPSSELLRTLITNTSVRIGRMTETAAFLIKYLLYKKNENMIMVVHFLLFYTGIEGNAHYHL